MEKIIKYDINWDTYNHKLTGTEFKVYKILLMIKDEVVSCLSYEIEKARNTEAVIFGVYTQEKYRGKGYGTILMDEAEKDIRNISDIKRIILTCDDNSKQQKFYEKLGYKYHSYSKQVLVWMEKLIK